jgi:hypothetical protein
MTKNIRNQGKDNARFLSAHMPLVGRVLDQTWKILQNSRIETSQDVMNLRTGLYLFAGEAYPRALCIEQDTLPEELEGGQTHDFPSCRIYHGGVLASSTDARLNLLVLVDLNWSQYRTELWLPWLNCDDELAAKGFSPSPPGSLYATRSGPRLRDIVSKLRFVDHHNKRNLTPSMRGAYPLSAGDLNVAQTQKMVLPRGQEGESYVIADELRKSPDLVKLRPAQGHNIQPYYNPAGQKLLGPTTTLGKTDQKNLPYI